MDRNRITRVSCAWIVVSALACGAPAFAGKIELVSQADPAGPPRAWGAADSASVSADGRFVAFASSSPNLVPGQNDGNGTTDVFVWDRSNGEVRLVSHRGGSTTAAASGISLQPRISADGRWIAFWSQGPNLVAGQTEPDSGPSYDLFLYDRLSTDTVLVTHAVGSATTTAHVGGVVNFVLSADGRFVAYESHGNLVPGQGGTAPGLNIFLYDRTTGTSTLVSHSAGSPSSPAAGISTAPSISADGRWVAYQSGAEDLIASFAVAQIQENVFLWDRTTDTTVAVSHATGVATTAANDDSTLPQISADGVWIAYRSTATNLLTGQTDSAETADLFLYERVTGTSQLVSHAEGSLTTTGDAPLGEGFSLSDDGSRLAYTSAADNLVAGLSNGGSAFDVFLFQRATGTNLLVSHVPASPTATGNGSSVLPALSGDGSRVAFLSLATNLVTGVTDANGVEDLFLWDGTAGSISLVSHDAALPQETGDATAGSPLLSADGRHVAFSSAASDLAASSDLNSGSDVFLHDAVPGTNAAVSFSPALSAATADGGSNLYFDNQVSADGRFILFVSKASNLGPGQVDANANEGTHESERGKDIFLYDRMTRSTLLVSRSAGSPVTTGNHISTEAEISRDGRYVAFLSKATDLVPGQVDNASSDDVFVFDRVTGTTVLASRSNASPSQANCVSFCFNPQISATGRYVSYRSLSGWRIFDRETGTEERLDVGPNTMLRISDDGRYVLFSSGSTSAVPGQIDTNGGLDLFLYDRTAGTVVLVSRSGASATTTGNAALYPSQVSLSADGRFATFTSEATNHVAGQSDINASADIFLFDRDTGTVSLVSRSTSSPATAANGRSIGGTGSRDGRFVIYVSSAPDLVSGQVDPDETYDLFLFDRVTGITSLVSHKAGSLITAANQGVSSLAMSGDASRIVFKTLSTDLIDGIEDENATDDVYLYERFSGSLELISRTLASPGVTANGYSRYALISEDGQVAVFASAATDLVAGDFNTFEDIFAFVPEDLDFYALEPCRVFDSRRPQDGPALTSGVSVGLQVAGACGVPSTARAVAVNVAVINPTGSGNLRFFPGDGMVPPTSTINFAAGVNRANNAILRLAPSGSGTLAIVPFLGGGGQVHVIVDVTGYYE